VGRSLAQLKFCEDAGHFFERAISVLEGAGKGEPHETVLSIRKMIKKCDAKSGNKIKNEKEPL